MASLMPEGKQRYTNNSGAPLSGGKVFTYAEGTTTPKATYSDQAGTVPNTNPVILNTRGEALIFWSGNYKVVVKDAQDNIIYTLDKYRSVDLNQKDDILVELAKPTGAGLIGFSPSGRDYQTIMNRMIQDVYFTDFTPACDGVSNDAIALTKALDFCKGVVRTTGMRVNLIFPTAKNILISYSKGKLTDIESELNNASQWAFYNINDLYVSAPGDWMSDVSRHGGITLSMNNSTIIVDGDANSYFFVSTTYKKIDIKDGCFLSKNQSLSVNCMFLSMLHSNWSNVSIEGFYKGKGFILIGERNTFTNLSLVYNKTSLVLGLNRADAWDKYPCNENRFFGCTIMYNGQCLAVGDEQLTAGYLEVNSSQNCVFYGGSFKGNKNPYIIRSAISLEFSELYFEFNGIQPNGAPYPGDGIRAPERAYRLHGVFDAISSLVSIKTNIHNVKFSNCYLGSYSNFLFKAGDRDGVQRIIDGVSFNGGWMGDQVYLIYTEQTKKHVFNVETYMSKVYGSVNQEPLNVGQDYNAVAIDDKPMRQYLVSYPTAAGYDFGNTTPSYTDLNVSHKRAGYSFLPDGVKIGAENSEKLNVYQAGLFSPKLLADGIDIATYGATYSAKGEYVRVGRLVYITFILSITAIGTIPADKAMSIGGLPFSPGSLVSGLNESEFVGVSSCIGYVALSTPINVTLDRAASGKLVLKHNQGNSYIKSQNLLSTFDIRLSSTYIA